MVGHDLTGDSGRNCQVGRVRRAIAQDEKDPCPSRIRQRVPEPAQRIGRGRKPHVCTVQRHLYSAKAELAVSVWVTKWVTTECDGMGCRWTFVDDWHAQPPRSAAFGLDLIRLRSLASLNQWHLYGTGWRAGTSVSFAGDAIAVTIAASVGFVQGTVIAREKPEPICPRRAPAHPTPTVANRRQPSPATVSRAVPQP